MKLGKLFIACALLTSSYLAYPFCADASTYFNRYYRETAISNNPPVISALISNGDVMECAVSCARRKDHQCQGFRMVGEECHLLVAPIVEDTAPTSDTEKVYKLLSEEFPTMVGESTSKVSDTTPPSNEPGGNTQTQSPNDTPKQEQGPDSITQSTTAPAPCPESMGFTEFTTSTSVVICVTVSQDSLTFDEAMDFCMTKQSTVVYLDILEMLPNIPGKNINSGSAYTVWIGNHYDTQREEWLGSQGHELKREDPRWVPGEPPDIVDDSNKHVTFTVTGWQESVTLSTRDNDYKAPAICKV